MLRVVGILAIYLIFFGLLALSVFLLWLEGRPVRDAERDKLRAHNDRQLPDTNAAETELIVTQPFTAWCDCPNCGIPDVHPFSVIYEHRPKTIALDPSDPTLVQCGPGRYARLVAPGLLRPIEPNYEKVLTGEVIRQCEECGHKWRQK